MSTVFKRFCLRPSCSNIIKRTLHQHDKSHIADKNFTTIYQLPYVRICAVVNKCKVPYLLGSGCLTGATFLAVATQSLPQELAITVPTVGFASTAALFAVSQVFTRLVGFAYISNDKKEVKLAYLDLWGNRQESVHSVDDITHLSDPSWPVNIFYKHLHISSAPKPYKISIKYGEAVEVNLLSKLFKYDFYEDE